MFVVCGTGVLRENASMVCAVDGCGRVMWWLRVDQARISLDTETALGKECCFLF